MTKKEMEKKIMQLEVEILQLKLQQKSVEYGPYYAPRWEYIPQPYPLYSPVITSDGTTADTIELSDLSKTQASVA